jgi:aspartate/methionine/tyrosine aminotransferase
MISDRIGRIELSPTLRISAKAKAMRAEGIDVIDFSVGEPDFPTPENVKKAGISAIEGNFTKYTQNEGIPELKEAIIESLKRDFGLDYRPNEIIVSSGAKNSLYNLSVALLNKGEEVIIPAPYWVSYPQQVALAKAKSVVVPTKEENGFRITPDELKQHISFNTKALILNNPSNPTGSAYPLEELEEIAKIVIEEDIFVIADEIYAKVIYDGFKFHSFASLGEEIRKRTAVINGVSKAYSMTGWRIGFTAAPKEIIAAMSKVQSHNTSNASSIAQMASVEAFNGPQFEIQKMVAEFLKRRNYLVQKLSQIRGVSCYKPQGAFYLFPNVTALFDKAYQGMEIRNSYGLSYYLLKEARVALVPGEAFGMEGYIRMSYATAMEKIEEGMDRILEALSKLKESSKRKMVRLDNYFTGITERVKGERETPLEKMDTLVEEAEKCLPVTGYYEWNANINGVIIQLRTNSAHLYEFWMESWYPAQVEADIEPHGIIYAVMDVPGREPSAFYNSESKTAVIFNTDFFKQAKTWALGMVADISERRFDVHSIRGGCVDLNGEGTILIGPPGAGVKEMVYKLLEHHPVKLHSDDWMHLRYRTDMAVVENTERKFYVETVLVKAFPDLSDYFDRCKCENVVMKKKYCTDTRCQQGDCMIDGGEPYCYWASKESRAILDPAWFGGPKKYAKRSHVARVVILQNDQAAPLLEKIDPEEGVKILSEGRYMVQKEKGLGGFKHLPFYNPYLLLTTEERLDLQARYFKHLMTLVPVYLVNTGAGSLEDIKGRLLEIMT